MMDELSRCLVSVRDTRRRLLGPSVPSGWSWWLRRLVCVYGFGGMVVLYLCVLNRSLIVIVDALAL